MVLQNSNTLPPLSQLVQLPELIFWQPNNSIEFRRATQAWQRGVYLSPNVFNPLRPGIDFRRHDRNSKVLSYPHLDPTSTTVKITLKMMGPQERRRTAMDHIRLVLTMHGTFKHSFEYIAQFLKTVGRNVGATEVEKIWTTFKDNPGYGSSHPSRPGKGRWDVENDDDIKDQA
ncbi:hypothetical protein MMC13_003561 [Lambiella insularis]|nr:hypothetical protein [Lambiella insularis]